MFMEDLLIVSNADLIWVKRYVENVVIPRGLSVKIVSTYNIKYSQFYKECGIDVETLIQGKYYQNIPYIRMKFANRKLRNILLSTRANFVNFFFVSDNIIDILSDINLRSNIILTYLGSDLLRRCKKYHKKELCAMTKSSNIIVMTEDMFDVVSKDSKMLTEKISVIDMGVSAINEIDNLRDNNVSCKLKILGRDNINKKIVTIGYNAIPQQQHIKVIESLMKLDVVDKQKIHLIVPLTYGRKDIQYIENVKVILSKSGFTYTILEQFMNDKEIAELCLATDYFINAQTTDAFSSSMIEHLYSNSVVINASWLSYKPLIVMGIDCATFHDFNELPNLIFKLEKTDIDINILKEYCSWDTCMNKWKKIYNNEW